MGLADLKKELKKLDKESIIKLIGELYIKNKSVKEYLDFYINPNENELFEKYHDKIFEAFYPKRGLEYNLSVGKKAISDFKKIGASVELVADLMLFYVETGVQFTNDFGDINEQFYLSLERTFVNSLTLIRKENLLDKFYDRASNVVVDTENTGWGFHDYISEVFYDFYPDNFEDVDEDAEKGRIININRNKQ